MDGPSNFFRQNYVLGPTNILLGLGVRIRVEAWPMHEYAFWISGKYFLLTGKQMYDPLAR